jgi:hypothetical protein
LHSRNQLLVALVVVLAACSAQDGTSPSASTFDAVRATSDLAALQQALGQPAWKSLVALGAHFDAAGASAAIVGTSALIENGPTVGARRSSLAVAERVMNNLTAVAATMANNRVLPVASLGHTFVLDPVAQRYVIAPDRVGAPAGGVRFILYAVDPTTQRPNIGQEIGYADLIDEGSDAHGIALHLLIVSGGKTALDYRVTLDGTPTAATLTVAGAIYNGDTRLQFHVVAQEGASPVGAASTVSFEIAIPEREFVATAAVQAVQSRPDHAEHVDLIVHSGPTTIALSVTTNGSSVAANVSVNGRPFATVSGDVGHPDIRSAQGRPLTPDETQALGGMIQLAGNVFQMFDGLMQPVNAVFVLAGAAQ